MVINPIIECNIPIIRIPYSKVGWVYLTIRSLDPSTYDEFLLNVSFLSRFSSIQLAWDIYHLNVETPVFAGFFDAITSNVWGWLVKLWVGGYLWFLCFTQRLGILAVAYWGPSQVLQDRERKQHEGIQKSTCESFVFERFASAMMVKVCIFVPAHPKVYVTNHAKERTQKPFLARWTHPSHSPPGSLPFFSKGSLLALSSHCHREGEHPNIKYKKFKIWNSATYPP